LGSEATFGAIMDVVKAGAVIVLGYAVALALQYLTVVGPYKRTLRQAGLAGKVEKVSIYDHILDHAKVFATTAAFIFMLTVYVIWVTNNQIDAYGSEIEHSKSEVLTLASRAQRSADDKMTRAALQTSDEELLASYNRDLRLGIDPDTARQWYEKAKLEVDTIKSQAEDKASTTMSEALQHYANAKVSAANKRAAKIVRISAIGMAFCAAGSGLCLLLTQAQQKKAVAVL
jgi:hypothetical protein